MEPIQLIILGLTGVSVGLCVYLITKLKKIEYLLEQPIVKKMSPALKLKPIKVDEGESHSHRHDSKPGAPANANRGPKPNFERQEPGERQNRDNQTRNERGPRPEGNGDRGPRNDRNDRNDRNFRDRNARNDRHGPQGGRDNNERNGGTERNRTRTETNSNGPELHAVDGASPQPSRPTPNTHENAQPSPTLAPRRPLPSTVDDEGNATKVLVPSAPVSAEAAADSMFMREDVDVQHGRRLQLKKKPRFDVSEEDEKSVPAEESKA